MNDRHLWQIPHPSEIRNRFRSSWCRGMVCNDLDGRLYIMVTLGGTFVICGVTDGLWLRYRSNGTGD